MHLPTLFLSHGGGPCFFMTGGIFTPMDSVSPAAGFLRGLEQSLALPARPTSLVVVSAHWEGEGEQVLIQSSPSPPLLFDYYGFPPSAYTLTWPAPGPSAALVSKVSSLLTAAGFAPALDPSRGYDHGVFVPLKLAFPQADIPTLQVSLHGGLGLQRHLDLGRALAPLRAAGALIIGSGFTTHNLQDINRSGSSSGVAAWAQQFDQWVARTLLGGVPRPPATQQAQVAPTVGAPTPYEALAQAMVQAPTAAPHFSRAHPRVEHLLPLYVALGASCPAQTSAAVTLEGGMQEGASGSSVTVTEIFSQIVLDTASFSSYRFD